MGWLSKQRDFQKTGSRTKIFYLIYLDCIVSSTINPLFNVDGLYISLKLNCIRCRWGIAYIFIKLVIFSVLFKLKLDLKETPMHKNCLT